MNENSGKFFNFEYLILTASLSLKVCVTSVGSSSSSTSSSFWCHCYKTIFINADTAAKYARVFVLWKFFSAWYKIAKLSSFCLSKRCFSKRLTKLIS
jgi:hypothetical protein